MTDEERKVWIATLDVLLPIAELEERPGEQLLLQTIEEAKVLYRAKTGREAGALVLGLVLNERLSWEAGLEAVWQGAEEDPGAVGQLVACYGLVVIVDPELPAGKLRLMAESPPGGPGIGERGQLFIRMASQGTAAGKPEPH